MYHLVYVSYATQPLQEDALIHLLRKARANNARMSISGMLLYASNKFIQVLEGEEATVRNLLGTIEQDPRHRKVSVVLEGHSRKRLFNGWSMGFKRLTSEAFSELSGYQDPEVFVQRANLQQPAPVLVFLQLFYKKNFVDYATLTPPFES